MCALQLGNSLVWDPPYCWGSERRKGLGIRPFQHLPLLWNHHIPEFVYIYLLKESSKNHLPIRHMWHLTIDSTLSFLPILYNCQYDNNCQKQCLGFDHWVHLLWTSPAIKALVRNPGAFTTLFALTRVQNVYSSAVPYTESRLTHSVWNKCASFPVIEHALCYMWPFLGESPKFWDFWDSLVSSVQTVGNFLLRIKSHNNIFQIKILTMFYYFEKDVFFIIHHKVWRNKHIFCIFIDSHPNDFQRKKHQKVRSMEGFKGSGE